MWIFTILFSTLPVVLTSYLSTAGDVIVGGLFEVFKAEDDGSCSGLTGKVQISSVMYAEAIKWYFDQLHEHGGLPFKIGLEARATCGKKSVASKYAVEFLQASMSRGSDNSSKPIVGLIGPDFSGEAKVVSSVLSSVSKLDMLLQIGFATTAVELSDIELYPNFVRVIPDDDTQIEVMLQSMENMKWNRISIVHENNLYAINGAEKLRQESEQMGICVVESFGIDVENGVDTDQVSKAIDAMAVNTTTGVVFFGSATTANVFFRILDSKPFSHVPVVMVSEGVNMDKGAFLKSSGTFFQKAQGSFGVAPLYRQVNEFKSYWKSIFTSTEQFNSSVASNPWLQAVFNEMTGCKETSCQFQKIINQDTLEMRFKSQPLFLQYALLAAHAMAKLIRNHCEKTPMSNICTDANNEFNPGDFLDEVKELTIDFKNDFSWSPQSLQDEQKFTISSEGGITFGEDRVVYQLFNFRRINGEFDHFKVGDYINGVVNVTLQYIRDYVNNEEKQWPGVRKAQCPKGYRCNECIPISVLQNSNIFHEGDAYIVGINSIFENTGVDGCGNVFITNTYQLIESIQFAIKQVMEGRYATLFSNLKVGFIGICSCNSGPVIQRKIYDLFTTGLLLANGTRVMVRDKILGFIGDVGSGISIAIAEVLTRLGRVQISYASTSSLLNDRTKYPYFMRVNTPDNEQAKAMGMIMVGLNVTYVQLIHSEGAYGEGGRDQVLEEAKKRKVCVLDPISVNENNLNTVYEKLQKHSEAKLVILFLRSHIVPVLIKMLNTQMTPGEFAFIGSATWAKNNLVLENDPKQITLGSVTLILEMYQNDALKDHLLGMEMQPFVKNPWITLYLQEVQNCFFELSFDKSKKDLCNGDIISSSQFNMDTWATSAYISTLSLLIASSNHFREQCGSEASVLCSQFTDTPDILVDEIKKVKLDLEGRGDPMYVFDTNGNGNIGYRIYTIQKDTYTPQSLIYKEIGRYPLDGEPIFKTNDITRHSSGFSSICPNKQVCMACLGDVSSNKTQYSTSKSTDGATIGLGVTLGLTVIIIVVLASYLLYIRRKQQADNDIYLHPSESNYDSGISADSNNTLKTRTDEHTCDSITACSMVYQAQSQSGSYGYQHHIPQRLSDNYEPLPTSSIPTEPKL